MTFSLRRRDILRAGLASGAATLLPSEFARADAAALQAPPVRGVMRQFVSEVFDKGWFNDREMWPKYLAMLAESKFNRLHLAFGLGYDQLKQVTDSYMLFLYPFLVDVPGYKVQATNLSPAERDANLKSLQFISEQTVAHGLEFELGVWMHGYELIDSPNARYVIEGLSKDNHAAYCRDALTAVLNACPKVSSVGLRIHGESGVAEGSYDFWATVFDGVPRSGRQVEIDLHAKGIDQTMIDRALATGMRSTCRRNSPPSTLAFPTPSGHPRARSARRGPSGQRVDGFERRQPQLHALRLRRSFARRPQVQRASPRVRRDAEASCLGRPRRRRGLRARVFVL